MAPRNKKNSTTIETSRTQKEVSEMTQENIIPFIKPAVSNKTTLVPEFAITIREAKKRIDMLKKFIDEIMVPGVDYGIIPGIDKPSLLKSGAEKLCDVFGFSKRVEVINRVEDWRCGIFNFEVRVTLVCKSTNVIEAEGIGCCNSRESKYSSQRGYDVMNTVLKMAKKRGLIDAVLSATRSSDLFTQDVEDMNWLWGKSSNNKVSSNNDTPVSMKQLSLIFSVVALKKIPVDVVKSVMLDKYKVAESKNLTISQANDLLRILKGFSDAEIKEHIQKELSTKEDNADS